MKKYIRYIALWGVGISVCQNVYRGINLSSMVWVVLLVFISKKTLADPPEYPKRIGTFLAFCAFMQGVLLYLYVSRTGIHANSLWSSLISTTLPLIVSAVAFFYIGTRKTEPNQTPEPTILTVTDRAPSSTLRASEDRGSS